MSAQLLDQFAAERPDLPHPIEAPAVYSTPPRGDYGLVDCQGCGAPLAEREYQPDYSYEGESESGSQWSGGPGLCAPCRGTDKADAQ